MKKISTSVYEKLTPRQRVAACIEAEARGDGIEVERLRRSCPRYTYSQLDIRYSEMMESLTGLAMAVEAELRECALLFIFGLRMDGAIARKSLQNFANIRDAWSKTLEKLGIDEGAMAAADPPSCP